MACLTITGNTGGKRRPALPVYYCTGRDATELCPGPASLIDACVEEQQAVAASERVEAAAREVADAEHELDLFVNNRKLLSVIGEQKFLEGVETRQQALGRSKDAARRGQDAVSSRR